MDPYYNQGQGQYYSGGPPQGQYNGGYQQQGGYLPPSGPPPGQYYQTGGGYNPQNEYQQGQQPPYGQIREGGGGQGGQNEGGQYFEYSQCNGKKKALLVGINYFGTSAELGGCINDVHNVQRFICQRFGYDPSDIVILTDDAQDPRAMPTRANIIQAMQWLVAGAEKNDSLFFHYSGHGTQTEDLNGDEGDDDDEAICPLDYEEAGLIIDDDSDHELLVRPLPAGCRLTAIFDSCHSGTVMDLPYIYSTEGKIKGPNYLDHASEGLMGAGMAAIQGNNAGMIADTNLREKNTSPADVIMWSGCKDDQTSADTQEAGKATGAMSYAFIAALTKYPEQSYMQLLNTVREESKGRYTQKPQLSACHPIDTDLMFVA